MVVEAAEPEPSGSIANPAATTSPSLSHRFLDSKFYLLVVVGEIVTEEHLRRAIGNIELGKRPCAPRGRFRGDAQTRPHPGHDGTFLLRHAPHPLLSPPLTAFCPDSFSAPLPGSFRRIMQIIRFGTQWENLLTLRDPSLGWVYRFQLATASPAK